MGKYLDKVGRTFICLILWGGPSLTFGADLSLEDFFGVYVGRAEVIDAGSTGPVGYRDLEMSIEAGKRGGFDITLISVSLVNGRRDVPGVTRQVLISSFGREKDEIYPENVRGSLFSKKKAIKPMEGDPIRWARIRGNTLTVIAFVVMPDGRFELQEYNRVRTKDGMDISFRRYVDGNLRRRVNGTTIKVD